MPTDKREREDRSRNTETRELFLTASADDLRSASWLASPDKDASAAAPDEGHLGNTDAREETLPKSEG